MWTGLVSALTHPCLACRPLTKVMDESTVPIGIPCMTEAQVGSRSFFFVRVHVQTDSLPEQRPLHQVSGVRCTSFRSHNTDICQIPSSVA